MRYGTWVLNDMETLAPTPNTLVQVQHHSESRDEAEESKPEKARYVAWNRVTCYREVIEPVRVTIAMTGYLDKDQDWAFASYFTKGKYAIEFDTLDGEPILDSIRMERL